MLYSHLNYQIDADKSIGQRTPTAHFDIDGRRTIRWMSPELLAALSPAASHTTPTYVLPSAGEPRASSYGPGNWRGIFSAKVWRIVLGQRSP